MTTKKCNRCGASRTSCAAETPAWCFRSRGCHTTNSGTFYCEECTFEWLGDTAAYSLQTLRDNCSCEHAPSAAAVQASLVAAGGVVLGGGAPPAQPGAPLAQPKAPPTGVFPPQGYVLVPAPPRGGQHLPLTDTGYRPPDRHLTDAERRHMDEDIHADDFESGSSNEEVRNEETQTQPSEMRQECARLDALDARVQVLENRVAGNVGCVSQPVLDPPSIRNRMASLEKRVDDLETKMVSARTPPCNKSSASSSSTRAST